MPMLLFLINALSEIFDWNEDQFLQMNGKSARASIREIFRSISPTISSSRNLIRFHLSSSSSSNENVTSLYHPSLLPLQKCRTITQLHQIHAHLITSGLFQHTFPASRVLKFSSDFGDFDYTILIFKYIHTPDTFCVNTVIETYSKTSHGRHQAVPFYFDMMSKGFIPNSFTFTSLLNSCEEICFGVKCHGQAVKNGVDNVVQVQNSLINMYGNFGFIDSAWKMFDGMSDRDLVSWNSIVNGYVKLGELGVAHRIFDKMPVRNEISFNIMISGYWKGGNPGCGLKVFREMIKMGFRGNETTMVSVLTACGRSARLKEGRSVHGSLIRNFMKSNLIIDTALIDMYSKCQRVESARRVFDNMLERNLVCWNAMVLGHCLHGCPEDGIDLFEAMVERVDPQYGGSGHNESKILLDGANVVVPDEVTFIGVLCACVRLGSVSKGRDYFNQLANVYSLKPNFAHYWCMANLYDGAGLIPEAEEILRRMPHVAEDGLPGSLVWGSLLGSCRFRGDVDLGVKIAMRLIELEPENASRYMLLFNIYAVAGRWEDTVKVKDMMKDRGVKRIPSCSLVGLNEVVHEFRLGENSQPCMGEVYTMLDELAQRLKLPMTGAFSLSDKAENRILLQD